MYARAVQQLPEGKEWVYEVKFDGYRCLGGRDSTGVTLWSRRGNRFTDQFPTIAKACEHLPPDTLLDGEIIALDGNGRISFNMLQHHRSQAQAILFYPFDVIIHRGRNLRHVPLETRRELLSDIVADLKAHTPLIRLSDTLDTTPAELIPLVKEFGFEGIIAKRKDSCYESGKRSGAWLKYKVNKTQRIYLRHYFKSSYAPGANMQITSVKIHSTRSGISGIDGTDFVRCRICGKHSRLITGTHLVTHDTDRETYMLEYRLSPDKLCSKFFRVNHSSRMDCCRQDCL